VTALTGKKNRSATATYALLVIFTASLLLPSESIPADTNAAIVLQPEQFRKVDRFSGKGNYYGIVVDGTGNRYIRARYRPPEKPVRLGCKVPDSCGNCTSIAWDWRVETPPSGSSEKDPRRNDSGAGVYLIFKEALRTTVLKYVYSDSLPAGTVVRHDGIPLQRMMLVVKSSLASSPRGSWQHVDINFRNDYLRLYKTETCPHLSAVAILTDGDQTASPVDAEYRDFILRR